MRKFAAVFPLKEASLPENRLWAQPVRFEFGFTVLPFNVIGARPAEIIANL